MVTSAARTYGLAEILEAVRLATSEVATNAVVHGGNGDVTIVLARWGDLFEVAVHDTAPEALPVFKAARDTDVSGRGMHLLEAVTDACGVTTSAATKAVWFHLKTTWPTDSPTT
ncbi:ATP-binding protein [Actinomadura craniellae]|nr:ATP-binding protein [Actinomadura craniellae]